MDKELTAPRAFGPPDWKTLGFSKPRIVRANQQLCDPETEVFHCTVLVNGIACRYQMVGGGVRAIVGLVLPGDLAIPYSPEPIRPDVGVMTLTSCEIIEIPCAELQARASTQPHLSRALARSVLMNGRIERAWLANNSHRPGDKRMAHLLCELRHRLAWVDLADDRIFSLPVTQQDLGDALGLSVVHVNRVLQHIKALDLIRIRDRTVLINDLRRLEEFAEFDPAYLA